MLFAQLRPCVPRPASESFSKEWSASKDPKAAGSQKVLHHGGGEVTMGDAWPGGAGADATLRRASGMQCTADGPQLSSAPCRPESISATHPVRVTAPGPGRGPAGHAARSPGWRKESAVYSILNNRKLVTKCNSFPKLHLYHTVKNTSLRGCYIPVLGMKLKRGYNVFCLFLRHLKGLGESFPLM